MDIKEKIRVIDGFPQKGISFKDVTTLLKDKEGFKYTIDEMVKYLKDKNIDIVVGPEARGFLFGAPVAYAIGAGFVPVRKKGKLPCDTISVGYKLEYGNDELEIHKDSIKPGQRVAIIDDLLATGGTINSVAELVERIGGNIITADFVIELTKLKGREKLKKYDIMSLIQYDV